MSESESGARLPEEEVKRVREGAAMALHEFRKGLMPLAGATEFCAARCRKLFQELEALAAELPESEAARLREVIEKPREQLPKLLEQSTQRARFLLASMEQVILAAQPDQESGAGQDE